MPARLRGGMLCLAQLHRRHGVGLLLGAAAGQLIRIEWPGAELVPGRRRSGLGCGWPAACSTWKFLCIDILLPCVHGRLSGTA